MGGYKEEKADLNQASNNLTLLRLRVRLSRDSKWLYYGYKKNIVIDTEGNLFKISLNQTEIRLYLSFFDWFGTKRTSVWFK